MAVPCLSLSMCLRHVSAQHGASTAPPPCSFCISVLQMLFSTPPSVSLSYICFSLSLSFCISLLQMLFSLPPSVSLSLSNMLFLFFLFFISALFLYLSLTDAFLSPSLSFCISLLQTLFSLPSLSFCISLLQMLFSLPLFLSVSLPYRCTSLPPSVCLYISL